MAAFALDACGICLECYAFENICWTHDRSLKQTPGIKAVQTESSVWRHIPEDKAGQGVPIDMLIDRKDGVINLCEMKFCDAEFVIDKKYAGELRTKQNIFRRITHTRTTAFLSLAAPYGLKTNPHSQELVQGEVTADDLFSR